MGGVLSKSAKAYWRRFGLIVGVALVPALGDVALKVTREDSWAFIFSPYVVVPLIVSVAASVLNGYLKPPGDVGGE